MNSAEQIAQKAPLSIRNRFQAGWSLQLIVFLAGSSLVALAYWVGLNGPFLLDDFANLADVNAWLDGHRTWQSVVFGNRSGPSGRPLAMVTFLLDGALWGMSAWHFKLTNLLLHLACGATLLALYRRLLLRDPTLSRHAPWLAILLTLGWMALPINASSVLYIVQRMAILSALYSLLALWLYVRAREQIERNEKCGIYNLFLGVPALTAMAFFSKENGALAPLIAAVIELAYFRPTPANRRPKSVLLFFGLFLALPGTIALIGLWLNPARIIDGYILRDFSLVERILTQPRILWEYTGSIFIPYGPQLGIFHDNYTKSTELLTPWTTLPAILGWLFLVGISWAARERYPSIFAGILLFLFGHSMESSVFPLELYFEHRNYLPSIGLLLAAAGGAHALLVRMPPLTHSFRRALAILSAVMLVILLAATHGRARVWSSLDTFYTQELRHNSQSPRLRSYLAAQAISAGNTQVALKHIAVAERNHGKEQGMTVTLWRLLAHCPSPTPPPKSLYLEARDRAHGPIQRFAMMAWEDLAKHIERGNCDQLNIPQIIELGDEWLAKNPLPDTSHVSWRTRYYLARLLATQSDLHSAAGLAERAWKDSGLNSGIGVFLFQVSASLGRKERCKEILTELKKANNGDLRLREAINRFELALQDGSISSTNPPQ